MKAWIALLVALFPYLHEQRYPVQFQSCEKDHIVVADNKTPFEITLFNLRIRDDEGWESVCRILENADKLEIEVDASAQVSEPLPVYLFADDKLIQQSLIEQHRAYTLIHNPEYRYVFETLSALCSVLELKCDIGIKLKEAYDAGDKEALLRYARFDLKEIAKRTEIFKDKMEYQWMQENKPFGFEVQDIRIGGVITRAGSAAKRVEAYVAGALERLEELEEPRLYFDCRHEDKPLSLNWNLWERIVSANVVSGV